MLYLANPCSADVLAAMCSGVLGFMDSPLQYNATAAGAIHAAGGRWAADNGAFSAKFVEARWWLFLERNREHADRALFAVAPDVVANAEDTLARSLPWLGRIRALGYPAAFAAQDGAEVVGVPWEHLDVLFIGGSTDWKLGPHARVLIGEAKALGKKVHGGRVNSRRRFDYFRQLGADSVDGTYLTFGPDTNLPKLLTWL